MSSIHLVRGARKTSNAAAEGPRQGEHEQFIQELNTPHTLRDLFFGTGSPDPVQLCRWTIQGLRAATWANDPEEFRQHLLFWLFRIKLHLPPSWEMSIKVLRRAGRPRNRKRSLRELYDAWRPIGPIQMGGWTVRALRAAIWANDPAAFRKVIANWLTQVELPVPKDWQMSIHQRRKRGPTRKESTDKIHEQWCLQGKPKLTTLILNRLAEFAYPEDFREAKEQTSSLRNLRERCRQSIFRKKRLLQRKLVQLNCSQ